MDKWGYNPTYGRVIVITPFITPLIGAHLGYPPQGFRFLPRPSRKSWKREVQERGNSMPAIPRDEDWEGVEVFM